MPAKFNTVFTFDLRTIPFNVESRFVVFTGGPLSGKTTVLEALGVPYESEAARVVIERELAKGKTKEQIRSDDARFQRSLDAAKLQIEASRPKDQPWFFDRAVPDSLTYHRAAGLDPSPMLSHCKRVRYAAVFLFDLLPLADVATTLADDPARIEDPVTRHLLDEYLESDYAALGYQVQRVPVMPIQERCRFVVERLKEVSIALPRNAR